eukprot:1925073-Prymnesium_polylepis.1
MHTVCSPCTVGCLHVPCIPDAYGSRLPNMLMAAGCPTCLWQPAAQHAHGSRLPNMLMAAAPKREAVTSPRLALTAAAT